MRIHLNKAAESAIHYLGVSLNPIYSFSSIIILNSVLGKKESGSFYYLTALFSLILGLFTLKANDNLLRFLSQYSEDKEMTKVRDIFSFTFYCDLTLSFIVLSGFLIANRVYQFSENSSFNLLLIGLSVSLISFKDLFLTLGLALKGNAFYSKIIFYENLLKVCISFPLVFIFESVQIFLFSQIAIFLCLIGSLCYLFRNSIGLFPRNFENIRIFLDSIKINFIISSVKTITNQIDVVFVGSLLNSFDVANFVALKKISSIPQVMMNPLVTLKTKLLGRNILQNNIKETCKILLSYTVLFWLSTFIVFFAFYLFQFYFDFILKDFMFPSKRAFVMGLIFSLVIVSAWWSKIFAIYTDQRYSLIANFIFLAFCLSLNPLMIIRFGFEGAILGQIITYFSTLLFYLFLLKNWASKSSKALQINQL